MPNKATAPRPTVRERAEDALRTTNLVCENGQWRGLDDHDAKRAVDALAAAGVLFGMYPIGDFGADIQARCRWALNYNNGLPSDAWSPGERIAVLLVLYRYDYLKDMGYTVAEAARRVHGDTWASPAEFPYWLAAVRAGIYPIDSTHVEGHRG